MNNRIQDYFKIGTLQWMSYPQERYDLVETVREICKDEYFSVIEIAHISDPEERKCVKKMLEQSMIEISYGAQPQLLTTKMNPNDIDEDRRRETVTLMKTLIDEAEYLGAKGLSFLAGKWEEETKALAYEQLKKTVGELCEYAAAKNMMLEMEVFDFDMDKKSLMGPASYVEMFAKEIKEKYDNFGILVDLSHFPTTYETSEAVISVLHPYITHLHIGNAVVQEGLEGYGDQHPRFGFPGSANDEETVIDFFEVLKKYGFVDRENPYILSMEVKPREYEDGALVITNTKRMINRAWRRLKE